MKQACSAVYRNAFAYEEVIYESDHIMFNYKNIKILLSNFHQFLKKKFTCYRLPGVYKFLLQLQNFAIKSNLNISETGFKAT